MDCEIVSSEKSIRQEKNSSVNFMVYLEDTKLVLKIESLMMCSFFQYVVI